MDLAKQYTQIKDKLDVLVFDDLWPGFKRYGFALYNDTQVILNGEILPKTEEFLANTAIQFHGEYIAIWSLTEEMDADVLASSIVHEMFHAWQMDMKESRFPNELEALTKYEYTPAYLRIKWQENKLLSVLCEKYGAAIYEEFLSLRKWRMTRFPYQYRYECGVEVIEGSAKFVELQALAKLNHGMYQRALAECVGRTRDINNLMPVRVLCYDIGAMLLSVCHANGLPANMCVGKVEEYLLPEAVFEDIDAVVRIAEDNSINTFFSDNINAFRKKIISITQSTRPVAKGAFPLLGVNIYSARYLDGFIYTEYFVMYEDQQPVTLYGNYLLEMKNDKIAAIYMDTVS